jgi:hypothetical protein
LSVLAAVIALMNALAPAHAADKKPHILHIVVKESVKALFLVDQFKVVTTAMHGEPILPTDEDYAGVEMP